MARELKDQTRKLCHQLQDKPDMDGNQREIKNHKKVLVDWIGDLKVDLRNLSYQQFSNKISKELANMNKFQQLREQEKEYNQKIKKVIEDQQKSHDEYTKDTDEFKQQIAELKQRVNETEVEAKLHIQYLDRRIEGQQSCRDREYLKEETKLMDRIKYLKAQLDTEAQVNKTIRTHLQEKETELKAKSNDVELKKDQQGEEMTRREQAIQKTKEDTVEEYDQLKRKIDQDDEERARRAEDDSRKQAEEEEKVQEKIEMDDAARQIQRKWDWYQKVGRFQKKKKKGKGKKKGKKK